MEVIRSACQRGFEARDSVAIRANQKSYTYHQLISSALGISKLLSSGDVNNASGSGKYGHLSRARVGIVAKPSAEFVAGVFATWFSGGVVVPLAISHQEPELLHVIRDSEVSVVFSTEDYVEAMQTITAKSEAQLCLLPPVHDQSGGDMEADGELNQNTDNLSGPALIVYTSGTTGKPKGVVHTHRSISALVRILAEAWEYTSYDQFLHCLPLHHVHGLLNALFAPLYAGSSVEFIPKFSVSRIWQRWRESYPNGSKADDAITVFTGAMEPNVQAASASAARQLRLMMSASSALPQAVLQKWENITGHRLLERYGMTEFVTGISNPLKGMRKPGTVGIPLPGVEVKIIEDESESNGVGELCIKSPSLFNQYWKLPNVTEESFTSDGYFKTGDACRIDEDGYYIIMGRASADIMKVGGYKLSALEIESVLSEHPAVAECCVLGLPDKDYGEAVSAIIVPESEAKRKNEEESKPVMNLEELRGWAKNKLAYYKLPTRLLIWESLPHNAMGKVNKKELRKLLSSQE